MTNALRSELAILLVAGLPVGLGRAEEGGGTFRKHVVVSQEGHASDIGREVLRKGGNAIDAAVATAFALAVTHPAAGNIGGGGFIVAYDAKARRVRTFDFREKAPAAATARMYVGGDGQPDGGHRVGLRAAGVPGTVRGLSLAHGALGSMPWRELVEPAARLARDGFPVSETLARSLNAQLVAPDADEPDGSGDEARLADFEGSVACFGKPGGGPWEEGNLLRQPDLARTLERIAREGPDDFYVGETARLIAEEMRLRGGLITQEDLKAYRAVEREPVRGRYRGSEVYGMGPPSSGGTVLLLMLNILETWDLAKDGPMAAETIHRVTEAQRRAYYHRARDLGDPDFVPGIPVERLISKAYGEELAGQIGERATPSRALADFPIEEKRESLETTHLSTIDAMGNAVALTYTLEQGYGCKDVIRGGGFLMNNEMGDFNVVPGSTNEAGRIGTAPNTIEPGKRMLSSQTPTLVLRDGRVQIVTGSPGGRTIPNTVLWVLLNVLEFGRSPREAVDAPRTHHGWFPDRLILEGRTWEEPMLEELARRGHALGRVGLQGDAHTIVVDLKTGEIHGVEDRRRRTSKASGD